MKSEATAIFAPQDGRWKITVSFDGRSDWLGRIGQLLIRAVRHLAAKTFEAIGGFTARDGLVGRYGPCDQTYSPVHAGTDRRTEERTDTVPLHRPCSAYYAVLPKIELLYSNFAYVH